jgi:hypothetical protein
MATTAAQVRNNLNTIAATIANSRANLDQCKTISAQAEFNAMVAEFNALKASSTQMKNATAAINY